MPIRAERRSRRSSGVEAGDTERWSGLSTVGSKGAVLSTLSLYRPDWLEGKRICVAESVMTLRLRSNRGDGL